MEYRPFEAGIEVNGQTVWAIVDGFKQFTLLASKYLLEAGVGEAGPDGMVQIDKNAWYSQAAWLSAFQKIGTQAGDPVLYQIGLSIPRNAKFPPWVQDIHSAVKSVDFAYHMNHRKGGVEMFDPVRGTMLEGIGHYGYQAVPGEKKIISVCENPYPCHFDRGIVTTMVTKFEKNARVNHDDSKPCRKKGGSSCTYAVTWI